MKIHKLRPLALVLAVLWSGSSLPGDLDEDFADIKKLLSVELQLWANCYPVNLYISLDADAKKILGDTVRTLIRSRLRAARLFNDGDPLLEPRLIVSVLVIPEKASVSSSARPPHARAFVITFSLYKFVVDGIWPTGKWDPEQRLDNNFKGLAITWEDGKIGSWGDRAFILSGVSELTDQFIDEYLRVNADACEG